MSVADVQRAFKRGLDGRAACRNATIELEEGGRLQRLNFHVVAGNGTAFLSEAIPADMCPMQHARHMAQEFLQGRLAGNSRFETQAPTQIQTQRTAYATPTHATSGALQDTQQAALPSSIAPPTVGSVAPALTGDNAAPFGQIPAAAPAAPTPAVPGDDAMVRMIDAGDVQGVIAGLCEWIDADAGAVRTSWTTKGDGQSLEYEQVRREINDLAYKLIEPSPEACPCLWASVGVDVPRTGNAAADIRAAASFINQQIDATNDFLARVRAVRLQAKADVRAAPDIAAAFEKYQAVIWPLA